MLQNGKDKFCIVEGQHSHHFPGCQSYGFCHQYATQKLCICLKKTTQFRMGKRVGERTEEKTEKIREIWEEED